MGIIQVDIFPNVLPIYNVYQDVRIYLLLFFLFATTFFSHGINICHIVCFGMENIQVVSLLQYVHPI